MKASLTLFLFILIAWFADAAPQSSAGKSIHHLTDNCCSKTPVDESLNVDYHGILNAHQFRTNSTVQLRHVSAVAYFQSDPKVDLVGIDDSRNFPDPDFDTAQQLSFKLIFPHHYFW